MHNLEELYDFAELLTDKDYDEESISQAVEQLLSAIGENPTLIRLSRPTTYCIYSPNSWPMAHMFQRLTSFILI